MDTSTIIIWILALAMIGVALAQSRETAAAGLRGSLQAARASSASRISSIPAS